MPEKGGEAANHPDSRRARLGTNEKGPGFVGAGETGSQVVDWALVQMRFNHLYDLGEVDFESFEGLHSRHTLRGPAPALVDRVN